MRILKSIISWLFNIIYKVLKWILTGLSYRIEVFRVEFAKRKANRLHNIDGKKYYVIRLSNRYYVYNAFQIKDLRRQKVFMKSIDPYEFSKNCVYVTK